MLGGVIQFNGQPQPERLLEVLFVHAKYDEWIAHCVQIRECRHLYLFHGANDAKDKNTKLYVGKLKERAPADYV